MIQRILLTIFLVLPLLDVAAQQRYLLLRKVGRPYQIIFEEGEEMRFRVKGEKHFIKDFIQGFSENRIRFHYYDIDLSEIEVIDIRDRNFRVLGVKSIPGKLIVAGIGLVIIDQANQVLIRDEPAGVSTGIAIVSGSLVAAGFIIRAIQKKYFRPGGKHLIEIVNYMEVR